MNYLWRRVWIALVFAVIICLFTEILLVTLNSYVVCSVKPLVEFTDDGQPHLNDVSSIQRNLARDVEVNDVTDPKIDALRSIVTKLIKQQPDDVGRSGRGGRHRSKSKVKSRRLELELRDESAQLIPFHRLMDGTQLYSDSASDSQAVDTLLYNLATVPISTVKNIVGGTQIKLNITLADGTLAILKPGRFDRGVESNPNHYYFHDFERHVAEIAAYHLDRLLEFRRVPPVAGRYINLTSDIEQLVDFDVGNTFFESPVGNLCFFADCTYYCDASHAICGKPDVIEASMGVYLPPQTVLPRIKWRHPWRRSYSRRRKAYWESDPDYCANVTSSAPYDSGRRLLDVIDMAIFDFLISNLDRHHYETFTFLGDDAFTLMLDNGKGFGTSQRDEPSCLAPLKHCCIVRLSTVTTLLRFHDGPQKLSDAMRLSLSRDKLTSVLTEGHLRALDRRLKFALSTIHDCVVSRTLPSNDFFRETVDVSAVVIGNV